jgi:hypothetical protein
MALTERQVIDKIEIVGEDRMIQVREATIILRDGVKVSTVFHRRVISPVDDVSKESQEIKDICDIVHTQEIKDAYANRPTL